MTETVYQHINREADYKILRHKSILYRRWYYRWWTAYPNMWLLGGYKEAIDFRPTELEAIGNIRHQADLANRFRLERRIAKRYRHRGYAR